jgi:integrase
MSTQIVKHNDETLDFIINAIEGDSKLQPTTKAKYKNAIQNAYDAGVDLTDPVQLNEYARGIGGSTASFLSAAIRKLAKHTEKMAKSKATSENVLEIQAIVYRAEALQNAISVERPQGEKSHTWLSQSEVLGLMHACRTRRSGNPEFDIITQRDRLAIGLLVGAGLRRSEAVNLRFDDVNTLPLENGKTRTTLDVRGKGAKNRIVPISNDLANAISEWGNVVGGQGYILRSLGRDKKPGEHLSTTSLYKIVQKRGEIMGKGDLQPHDLRRTYAQIGYDAGVPIPQISKLLGHSDVKTTMRYLKIDIDFNVTISDFVTLKQ